MNALHIIAIIFAFLVLILAIFIVVNRKFLRFNSLNDFASLDCYLYEKKPDLIQTGIIEQLSAAYLYDGKLIYFQAVIYETKRDAARQFNKYNVSMEGFAFYIAKCFSRGPKKITKARLFKNTFLLAEGEPGAAFNSFYNLILHCLSKKRI